MRKISICRGVEAHECQRSADKSPDTVVGGIDGMGDQPHTFGDAVYNGCAKRDRDPAEADDCRKRKGGVTSWRRTPGSGRMGPRGGGLRPAASGADPG
ncbi:hypothetical protein D3C81_1858010 [compost metagenome]